MDNIIFRMISIPAKDVSQPLYKLRLTAVDGLQRLAGGNCQRGIEKRSPD
jgi:hypothetical protein